MLITESFVCLIHDDYFRDFKERMNGVVLVAFTILTTLALKEGTIDLEKKQHHLCFAVEDSAACRVRHYFALQL